ncbi:hypothetical protein BOTBODRAFT_60080 [Botryobasidium botryosum FD-172 SS1]|uniref:J domain-containing protein n=1 Tax=Botryobasidium botryosum (strain FD-172 SS1) TaxID=930990 RepID=A0A067M657_BOTB1|nr:hypothetical protein BOTBODRAFT_60080 [Botryobasidium botryosum FD-172 SS1]
MAEEEQASAYEVLAVEAEATEADIRRAYRQRSLKVHPDRHPNNPDAAQKFHELTEAYNLLLDPIRRSALDAQIKIKNARKLRFAAFDSKRKNLQEELEERERAFKKARGEKDDDERKKAQELERIKEEGRRMMREREEALLREQKEKEKQAGESSGARVGGGATSDAPPEGLLDTTIRLKYSLSEVPHLTTSSALAALLSSFGPIDSDSIVLSLKTPKPSKKPERSKAKPSTALVPLKNVGDAFAAVLASGRKERGLEGIEVSWAGGEEPEIVKWLKRNGKLGMRKSDGPAAPQASARLFSTSASPATPSSSTFSSFPESLPTHPPPIPQTAPKLGNGLDFESLTLMRLRQAEREKLEREIRAQEADE